ncbi:hypothetical protein TKK_0005940 [Trichogramma kaykai]
MGGSILRGKLTEAALFRILKNQPIFHPDGTLKTRTRYCTIWKEAAKELRNFSGFNIPVDTLYFHVRSDTRCIKTKLEQYHSEKEKTNVCVNLDTNEKINESVSVSSDENEGLKKSVYAELDINEKINESVNVSSDKNEVTKKRLGVCLDKNEETKKRVCIRLDTNIISDDNYSSPVSNYENKEGESDYENQEEESDYENQEEESDYENQDEESDYKDSLENLNPLNLEPIHFSIKLSEDQWRTIKTDKSDCTLKPRKWTPIIARLINEERKVFCAFSFKYSKKFKNLMPEKYFEFRGKCVQCRTSIYGCCNDEPKNDSDGVEIKIDTFDTYCIPHYRKRQVINVQRKEAKQKLLYTTASRHRNEMADDLMNFSQCEPSDLPSLEVLRKMKEEALNEFIGLNLPITDPIKALLALAKDRPFVKKVCAFPFRVIYWYDQQIELWNRLAKFNPVISIDATGSVIKSVVTEELKNSHVMLFQIISKFDNTYAPLFQMACARQDTNVITAFINEWANLIELKPREVTTDMSLALLNSICLSFNKCTYKSYLNTCLQY